VHVHGLGLTLHVSVNVKLCKFILCHVKQHKCKCKIKYIHMVLHDYVKECKCKTNTFIWFYALVLNNVKKLISTWRREISWCLWW
jgi:hypothetical protein